jgi:hypothetical protein
MEKILHSGENQSSIQDLKKFKASWLILLSKSGRKYYKAYFLRDGKSPYR